MMPPKRQPLKRKSVTDWVASDAEKLMSGVERELVKILDADTQSDELRGYWPDHPFSCEVVVPGPKGTSTTSATSSADWSRWALPLGSFPTALSPRANPRCAWRPRSGAVR